MLTDAAVTLRRPRCLRAGAVRAVICDGLLLAAWLASAGLVVLHERGQLWGGFSNPAASLGATLEAKEQWFGIYYQNQKIGFSHLMMTPDELNGVPGVSVTDRGWLSFNLLGTPQRVEVVARAFIDDSWRLQTFNASLRTDAYRLKWTGRRAGDELLLTVDTPTNSLTNRLKDPTGSAFVNGLSSWAAFHRLRVGQSGRAWVLNPLSLSPEVVYFHVRRSERLDGQEAFVIESDVAGMTATTWVTPSGDVLKEQSALGLELRRESSEQMLKGFSGGASDVDLLSAASVPIDRPIERPDRVSRLVLLIEGAEGDDLTIQRPWQQTLPQGWLSRYRLGPPPDGPWCLVQLDRPDDFQPAQDIPLALERYRKPSLFVQSDDVRILTKARAIVGSRTGPWDRVEALNRWVFSSVTKRLTVGLPSAVDILSTLSGDCHEHTILFTALARSLGLPTRMVAGLVYWQGRLYYHAWPEVWMGQWVPTDPTLGQAVADATHLGLTEAENEHLIMLGQFVGKLRIQVLDVQEAASSVSSGHRPVSSSNAAPPRSSVGGLQAARAVEAGCDHMAERMRSRSARRASERLSACAKGALARGSRGALASSLEPPALSALSLLLRGAENVSHHNGAFSTVNAPKKEKHYPLRLIGAVKTARNLTGVRA